MNENMSAGARALHYNQLVIDGIEVLKKETLESFRVLIAERDAATERAETAERERLEDRRVFEQSASLSIEAVERLEQDRNTILKKYNTLARDCGALLRGIAFLKSEAAITKVPERVKLFLSTRKELHGSILRTCDGVETDPARPDAPSSTLSGGTE